MLYFSRCPFPLKYCVCRKCLHLQFTTYHICDRLRFCNIFQRGRHRRHSSIPRFLRTASGKRKRHHNRPKTGHPFSHRLSTHAFSSACATTPFSIFPSSKIAPGQLGASFSFVLPIPLPPEVANGTIILPEKS